MPAKMLRRLCEILPALLIALVVAGSALAQSAPQPAQPPAGPVTSAPMTALVTSSPRGGVSGMTISLRAEADGWVRRDTVVVTDSAARLLS